jgi:hypothetical protein
MRSLNTRLCVFYTIGFVTIAIKFDTSGMVIPFGGLLLFFEEKNLDLLVIGEWDMLKKASRTKTSQTDAKWKSSPGQQQESCPPVP